MSEKKNRFIRLLENAHVGLWLLKDTFWMLEIQVFALILIVPTTFAAIWILFKTIGRIDSWGNLAVLFWIIANSVWMLSEFFPIFSKMYSLPFFVLGIISVVIYLILYVREFRRLS